MAEIDWEATARRAGWEIGFEEPHGSVLVHEDQERIWPLGDWEGALRDLGFEEDDQEWVDDIVYLRDAKLTIFRR